MLRFVYEIPIYRKKATIYFYYRYSKFFNVLHPAPFLVVDIFRLKDSLNLSVKRLIIMRT